MRIRDNKGFTLIELLIVVAIIGVIAAIAVPGLLRARMSGNEASAIGSMRAITSSQQAFAASCANGFYAASLTDLGTPPVAGQAAFISPDLIPDTGTSVLKSGYNVELKSAGDAVTGAPAACNAGTIAAAYTAWADPLTDGSTGSRHFFTNTSGAIFQSTDTSFAAETAASGAPVVVTNATPIQ